MRAVETQRKRPIVRDPKAMEILGSLDYDFSHLRRLWMTQLDTAVRTEIFDQGVQSFLAAHPNPTVVTLGAGLDGRFWRLDDGRVQWFDLDLPEVIALRRRFYGESPRNRFLAKSILDFTWIDDVGPRTGGQVLILAEGLLHYFEESAVRRLFAEIAGRLPGAELLFHSTSPYAVRRQPRSRAFRDFDAQFGWGIATGRDVEPWDPRYEFLAEWAFVDRHPSRWRWVRLVVHLPVIGRQLRSAMKITHLRFRP
jgi:O-methyltransferase involved in polyketide biosynthesis